jgi:PST family polysaccharide transporter
MSPILTWAFLDKTFRVVLILATEILIARYLGPEQFGIYSYIIVIFSLLLVISSFGMDNNLVKDFVQSSCKRDSIITSGTLIKFIGGVCSFFIAILWSHYYSNNFFWLIFFSSFGHLFQWTKVFELFYQSQDNYRLIAFAYSFTGLLFFIIKLILIFQESTIKIFCFVYALELITTGLIIFIIYLRTKKFVFQLDLMVIKHHIQMCWPLVLSGIAVSVYLKIDQVMLLQFVNSKAVGIYAAAIKLSEGWYFIGGLLTTVVAPHIYRLHKLNHDAYENFLKKLTAYLILLALIIVILVSLTSEFLLNFLYGSSYQGASTILNIHIWALFFAYLGCVQGLYWIAEGLQKIFLYQNLCSAVLNIFLNILLIPKYEGVGAAWATVISYGLPVLAVPYIVTRAKRLHSIHIGSLHVIFSIFGLKK